MLKAECVEGVSVFNPARGYGRISNPLPQLRTAVKVRFGWHEELVNCDELEPKLKPVDQTRAQEALLHREKLVLILNSPLSYWLVGYLLASGHHVYASIPRYRLDCTIEALTAAGVENVELATVCDGPGTGEVLNVNYEVHGREKEFEDSTGVISHLCTMSKTRYEICSTIFIRDFLMRELGFQLGVTKATRVIARVPERFMKDFKEGVAYSEGR